MKACAKKDEGGQYFLCTHHEMQSVSKKIKIKRVGQKDKKEREYVIEHTFLCPTGVGVMAASKPVRERKGLAWDRAVKRQY